MHGAVVPKSLEVVVAEILRLSTSGRRNMRNLSIDHRDTKSAEINSVRLCALRASAVFGELRLCPRLYHGLDLRLARRFGESPGMRSGKNSKFAAYPRLNPLAIGK